MAQVNITLSHEEVLQILSGNRDDGFKILVERILNQMMLVESAEQLGAEHHERTDERQDYRNGIRERRLNTRIGTLTLAVPRHRNEPFHTMIFNNYQRSEAALISTMVQMVINGVSTRKVQRVIETLCGTSFSKSAVSELCKKIDMEIEEFKNRSLEEIEAPFLMVDATYFKARENHKIVSKAFFVALAVTSDGNRQIIGFDVHDTEDNYSWQDFFRNLKSRGLSGVRMVISDAHKSILNATVHTFSEAAWQRCQVHFQRNILSEVSSKYQPGLILELRRMFNAKTLNEARTIRDEIIEDYRDVARKAMEILDNGFEDAMTVMQLPQYLRPTLRTSNMIERLNRELKRRSEVIQVFPNPESILRLMGAVIMECHDQLSVKQKVYSKKSFEMIKMEVLPKLREIATTQQSLLDAA